MDLSVSDIKNYVKTRLDEYSNNEDAALVGSDQSVEDLDRMIENAIVPAVRKIHLEAPNVLLNEGWLSDSPVVYEGDGSGDDEEHELSVTPNNVVFDERGYVTSPVATGGREQVILVFCNTDYNINVSEGAAPTPTPTNVSSTPSKIARYMLTMPQGFLRLVSLKLSTWDRPINTLVNEDSVEYRKQMNRRLKGTNRKPVGALARRHNGIVIELFSGTNTMPTLDFFYYVPKQDTDNVLLQGKVWVADALKYPCLNQITAEVLHMLNDPQRAMLYESLAVRPFYIDSDYERMNPPLGERFNKITNQ